MDYFKEPETKAEMLKQLLTITGTHGSKGFQQEGDEIILYQCDGTGLLFPGDYLEMWGRKYGIGLGKKPVSECLDSSYTQKTAQPEQLKSVEQIMFPLKQGGYGITPVKLTMDEVKKGTPAILMMNDPFMQRRGKLLRQKQLDHPNG